MDTVQTAVDFKCLVYFLLYFFFQFLLYFTLQCAHFNKCLLYTLSLYYDKFCSIFFTTEESLPLLETNHGHTLNLREPPKGLILIILTTKIAI